MVSKIEFHAKYCFLPGSLVSPTNVEQKVGAEVDSKFEFVLEVLDYLEALMKVQNAVFRTMDKSRNSTQTASGHCRLSACIPIILDSQEWYYFFFIYQMVFRPLKYTEIRSFIPYVQNFFRFYILNFPRNLFLVFVTVFFKYTRK